MTGKKRRADSEPARLPLLYTHSLPELRRGTLSAAPGSTNNNNTSREDPSPWPESHDGAIVFLLDARDDFEARLLRTWVESGRPETVTRSNVSFV